jgi:acetolactate synthase I/II/III large subunit
VLAAVTQAASGRLDDGSAARKAWLEELRAVETQAYEKRLPRQLSDTSPIDPYRLVHEINEFLTEDSPGQASDARSSASRSATVTS